MKNRSIPQIISQNSKILIDAGIEQGQAEIEIVLCNLLEVDRLNLFLEGENRIDNEIIKKLDKIVSRRATREPLQYILEESWFYGRKFFVSPAVMIPTPETEILCECGIRFINQSNVESPKILDIGVGSGVISITVASELKVCKLTALDISNSALEVAKQNAEIHKVTDKIEFRESDFFSSLKTDERFDLILSNPPYISDGEYEELPPEVLADPKVALTSGNEGMDAIEEIVSQAPNFLNTSGKIMFEIGYNQAELVKEITAQDNRYNSITILKDLNETDRVVILSCGKT